MVKEPSLPLVQVHIPYRATMASAKLRTDPDLPMDIIVTEILSRLPVKSLLQLKSVCKYWYALIGHPSFIAKHLNRSISATNNGVSPFLFLRDTSDAKLRVLSLLREDTLDAAVDFEIPTSIKVKVNGYWDIVGSCNGLLVVSDSEGLGSEIILWNPATREFRELPRPGITHAEGKVVEGVTFGFGFNPKTTDHKLVRIIHFLGELNQDLDVQVEMYSQSTDSWREIDAAMPTEFHQRLGVARPFLPRTSRAEAVVGGALHWTACVEPDEDRETIIAFDMVDEVFRQISVPGSDTIPNKFFISLVVLEGCLGAVIIPTDYGGNNSCFDLWVMKEYGVHEAWTKQFTIGPFANSPLKVVGCWKNGELIIQEDVNELFLYDPNTQLIEEIRISGACCNCTYTESLVSVGRRDGV